jgi:multidrug resistance efflux pump
MTTTRKRLVRVFWIVGIAILVAGAAGAGRALQSSSSTTSAALTTTTAAETAGVICFGHVDVEGGVTSLYPLVPGRVARVDAHEGDVVKADAVLFHMDDRLAAGRMREAEAALRAAQAELADARKLPEQQRIKIEEQQNAIEGVRHRLEGARQILARKRDLVRVDQLSSKEASAAAEIVKELEAAEKAEIGKLRELKLRDPSLTVARAEADVQAKEAQLDQAKRARDECLLRAPVNGTVLRVLVNPGDVLGAEPKQAAIMFCPTGVRLIRAEVEQEFAGRVAVGQAATIYDDSTSGPTWRGKVTRISDWYTHRRSILQEPFQFNDVRTLECLVAIDPGQPQLRIGQRVRVALGP